MPPKYSLPIMNMIMMTGIVGLGKLLMSSTDMMCRCGVSSTVIGKASRCGTTLVLVGTTFLQYEYDCFKLHYRMTHCLSAPVFEFTIEKGRLACHPTNMSCHSGMNKLSNTELQMKENFLLRDHLQIVELLALWIWVDQITN